MFRNWEWHLSCFLYLRRAWRNTPTARIYIDQNLALVFPVNRLSCGNCQGVAALFDRVERCVLLNLPGFHCDVRNVEARKPRDSKRIKLGSIESLVDASQRAGQSSMNRIFFCQPESLARTRSLHPHKVPAGFSNHHVKI